jgi:hypothetical protein
VLSENEDRIRKLFVTSEINAQSVYGIVLTKNGAKITVVVDDHIPCKNHIPAFAHPHGHELWVILLEKAWAKIHGSYERTEGG